MPSTIARHREVARGCRLESVSEHYGGTDAAGPGRIPFRAMGAIRPTSRGLACRLRPGRKDQAWSAVAAPACAWTDGRALPPRPDLPSRTHPDSAQSAALGVPAMASPRLRLAQIAR